LFHGNLGRALKLLARRDIAGQERYGNLTRVYYKEAVAAFVVFDLTRNSSFESVKRWKDDIDNVRPSC
jgi:GTPase SAR1 family protein